MRSRSLTSRSSAAVRRFGTDVRARAGQGDARRRPRCGVPTPAGRVVAGGVAGGRAAVRAGTHAEIPSRRRRRGRHRMADRGRRGCARPREGPRLLSHPASRDLERSAGTCRRDLAPAAPKDLHRSLAPDACARHGIGRRPPHTGRDRHGTVSRRAANRSAAASNRNAVFRVDVEGCRGRNRRTERGATGRPRSAGRLVRYEPSSNWTAGLDRVRTGPTAGSTRGSGVQRLLDLLLPEPRGGLASASRRSDGMRMRRGVDGHRRRA